MDAMNPAPPAVVIENLTFTIPPGAMYDVADSIIGPRLSQVPGVAQVNIAGADRIGHGADLRWERNPDQILRSMKSKGTCLEANLTSNQQILRLSGKRHPITDYVRAGVKVTLSTDDEGVSRTDLTAQYVKAVRQHGFGYRRLKQFATYGLRCAFLTAAEKKAALADQKQRFRKFEARFPSR